MKYKIRVFQFRKDKRLRRILVDEKTLPIADLKYVVVDGTPLEIRPEYVCLTEVGKDLVPVILIREDLSFIDPNSLVSEGGLDGL